MSLPPPPPPPPFHAILRVTRCSWLLISILLPRYIILYKIVTSFRNDIFLANKSSRRKSEFLLFYRAEGQFYKRTEYSFYRFFWMTIRSIAKFFKHQDHKARLGQKWGMSTSVQLRWKNVLDYKALRAVYHPTLFSPSSIRYILQLPCQKTGYLSRTH